MRPIVGIENNELMVKLASLDLPTEDYAIFGSGPLLAWGIRDHIRDLDVVARGAAWSKATALGCLTPSPAGNGNIVRLKGGKIEIFDRWIDSSWNTDTLIDSADIIAGFRFVNLAMVHRWKMQGSRDKDKRDAEAISEFIKYHSS